MQSSALRSVMLGALSASLCALAACSGDVSDGAGAGKPDAGGSAQAGGSSFKPCEDERGFSRQVWGRVLGKVCINCHAPDGVAAEQNAMLRLLPSAYPGFLDANFENAAYVAKFSFEGKSLLLRKPLGEMSHGGGVQLKEGDEEYAILSDFVAQVEQGEACTGAAQPPSFADLVVLDADSTYRKATLQLAGRLPTTAERERLSAGDETAREAALPELLDALMREEAFIERVVELYNDKLLTDFYLRYVGAAIGLLGDNDYPNAAEYYDTLPEATRERANRGIAREPLWIIGHVVRNDRPFSEILTADYTVVNADSALVYGLDPSFQDRANERELVEQQVMIQRMEGAMPVPHAGLLSTPAFLNRFPTSPTNRSRHRARKIYEFFLATDILKSGARPLDPLAATSFNNPTRDDPQCNGCHRQIDPIAGGFLKWNERDMERYEPMQNWHTEMVAPGFGQEVMDTSDYPDALQWLGARIVADPRFVLATVYTAYEALTGHEPLAYPRAEELPDQSAFDAKLAAWEAQDATFRAVGQRFVEENMNFKTVVRELVLSPYFRAQNTSGVPSAERAAQLDGMGTGRLISPERLSLKINAIAGVPWARSKGERPFLLTDYKILYGGIDSDTVVDRLSQPNGIMANVALRMANEISCRATAWDFTKPEAERVLFPHVSLLDVPESETGAEVPAQIERIKKNLAHLYGQLLDEQPDEAELARAYGLFYETWKDGNAGIATSTYPKGLPGACRARENPLTAEPLAEGTRIEEDERYTVRAWMAVMTYLLSDYGFLYE